MTDKEPKSSDIRPISKRYKTWLNVESGTFYYCEDENGNMDTKDMQGILGKCFDCEKKKVLEMFYDIHIDDKDCPYDCPRKERKSE